jgi:hypothetical protein
MTPEELDQDIINHWNSFRNPIINDILINLEKLETTITALSHEEKQAVADLVDYCSSLKPDEADARKLIDIFNQLPAAYMLYMIHKLQSLNADLVMKIINYAQKNKDSSPDLQSFFLRNMVFEKSQLLGRIFAENRMKTVLSIL